MKLQDLSLRQVAVAVPLFVLLDWAFFQFVGLPNMTEAQRKQLYAGSFFSPYGYGISIAFVCFAIWFVFFYSGRWMTHGRKVAIFALALGSVGGMLTVLIIRLTWHI